MGLEMSIENVNQSHILARVAYSWIPWIQTWLGWILD